MPVNLKSNWLAYAALAFFGLLAVAYFVGEVRTIRISQQRAKQKRAIAELREVATAIHSYMQAHEGHPPEVGNAEVAAWRYSPLPTLQAQLVPAYAKVIPATDPWGATYIYAYSPQQNSFCLISFAKGGKRDSTQIPSSAIETSCFENDIIWSGNSFVPIPGGMQHFCEVK